MRTKSVRQKVNRTLGFLGWILILTSLSGCAISSQPRTGLLPDIPSPTESKMAAVELVMPQELRDIKLTQRSLLAGLANQLEADLGHDVLKLLESRLRSHFSDVTLTPQRTHNDIPAIVVDTLAGNITSGDLSLEIRLKTSVYFPEGKLQHQTELVGQGKGNGTKLFFGGALTAGGILTKAEEEALSRLSGQFDGVIDQVRAAPGLPVGAERTAARKRKDLTRDLPMSIGSIAKQDQVQQKVGTTSSVANKISGNRFRGKAQIGARRNRASLTECSLAEVTAPKAPPNQLKIVPEGTGKNKKDPVGTTGISAHAMTYYRAGMDAVRDAKKTADYQTAAQAFALAADVAPAWPVARYNLARVLAELDRPYEAMLAYRKYLALAPGAPNQAAVIAEIDRLQTLRMVKRRISLPGVTFAAMEDGIYVMRLLPGSPIAKKGLHKGDKIIEVNMKPVAGSSLREFFQIIDEGILETTLQKNSNNLMGRRIRGINDPLKRSQSLLLKCIRGGSVRNIVCKKNIFANGLPNIEAAELGEIVRQTGGPTAVLFWADWCKPGTRFAPVVEAASKAHIGEGGFYSINITLDQQAANTFHLQKIPTLLIFAGNQERARLTGLQSRKEVEAFIAEYF